MPNHRINEFTSSTDHPKIPNILCWFFTSESLRGKKFIEEIDFIRAHTEANLLLVMFETGVITEDYDQCHDMVAELVDYAHSRGLGIALNISACVRGFFNSGMDPNTSAELELYTIRHPEDAQGIAVSGEVTADENGYAVYTHHAKWGRNKIRPLRTKLLKVYAFDKTGEGLYEPSSLADVTKRARIVECRTHSLSLEIDAGQENAGKTLFVTVVQYYNWPELFGDSDWKEHQAMLDVYAGIPLDGIVMDEYGYMLLNASDISTGTVEPFRGFFYSPQQKDYFAGKLGLDLDRMMLDVHYAPKNDEAVRIRAVNRYFNELRAPVLREENRVAEYARKLFGENIYLGTHNTFHNDLANDEIWHTACCWWDLPRYYGHTDETLAYPIRMGIMLAAKNPLMFHMYYSKNPEDIYNSIVSSAPFGIREIHHAFDDFHWGSSYHEPELLKKVQILDRALAALNEFQSAGYPRFDLLIIYGNTAQNNWYPDYEARNCWNLDGKMNVQGKCDEIWNAGYRAALVPDYAITDGRIKLCGNRISFNGYEFAHCLFLYPKYADKRVYAFLNKAYEAGVPLAVVGCADIDFDAEPVHLKVPTYPAFSLSLLEQMGCPKENAIPNGGVYADGSFVLVHKDGLLNGTATQFDFTLDGVRYSGGSTGILAYRAGTPLLCTEGGSLNIGGERLQSAVVLPIGKKCESSDNRQHE